MLTNCTLARYKCAISFLGRKHVSHFVPIPGDFSGYALGFLFKVCSCRDADEGYTGAVASYPRTRKHDAFLHRIQGGAKLTIRLVKAWYSLSRSYKTQRS